MLEEYRALVKLRDQIKEEFNAHLDNLRLHMPKEPLSSLLEPVVAYHTYIDEMIKDFEKSLPFNGEEV